MTREHTVVPAESIVEPDEYCSVRDDRLSLARDHTCFSVLDCRSIVESIVSGCCRVSNEDEHLDIESTDRARLNTTKANEHESSFRRWSKSRK